MKFVLNLFDTLLLALNIFAHIRTEPKNVEPESRIFVNMHSVTSLQGLEEFYLRMRQRKMPGQTESLEESDTKSEEESSPIRKIHHLLKFAICKNIFCQSQYAELIGEELMYPKRAKKILKSENHTVFSTNFEKRLSLSSRGPWMRSKYKNKSKFRVIHVREKTRIERVFTCVVKNRSTGDIKQYFVSDTEYDVNEAQDGKHIGARFIFAHNDDNNLVVHALAEEPADMPTLPLLRIESLYLSRRKKHKPAVEARKDPVCGLDRFQKLRLCHAVSTKFRLWWRIDVSAKIGCEKRIVTFQKESIRIRAGTKKYEEWMMACKIIRLFEDTQTDIMYYVSRAYQNNEVFIFSVRSEGDANLEYHGRRVSVIIDDALPVIPEDDEIFN